MQEIISVLPKIGLITHKTTNFYAFKMIKGKLQKRETCLYYSKIGDRLSN